MAAKTALNGEHHVLRYASATRRFVSADATTRGGPSPGAFAMRQEDEGGMSVTEVEHFGEFCLDSRRAAAVAHRQSTPSKKLGGQAIFARARVNAVMAAGHKFAKTIRVVHAPVDGNPAHAEIRRLYPDDLSILEYLATDIFLEYDVVADMDLPSV